MQLNNLRPAKGSTHKRKRVGRGQGSGAAGTASRGHKGAKSRSGYSMKKGFEGGQMPLQRRIPKRGFKNVNRTEYVCFNLDRLQAISEKFNTADITVDFLKENKFIQKSDLVKVLGRGELTAKLNVTVHAGSASAKEAIEKAGGSINLLNA